MEKATNEQVKKSTVSVDMELPSALHRALKITAAEDGVALTAVIVRALAAWVAAEGGAR